MFGAGPAPAVSAPRDGSAAHVPAYAETGSPNTTSMWRGVANLALAASGAIPSETATGEAPVAATAVPEASASEVPV